MKKTVIIFCKYENHARNWFKKYVDTVHPVGKIKRQRIDTPKMEIIFTGEARLTTISRAKYDPVVIYWDGDNISDLLRMIEERAA